MRLPSFKLDLMPSFSFDLDEATSPDFDFKLPELQLTPLPAFARATPFSPSPLPLPTSGDPTLSVLQRAGFKGDALKTAWAVMKGESGGNPRALNPNASTGDLSYGLFQINMLGGLGPARRKQYGLKTNEALYDPLTNARVAYRMSNGGRDWSPWSAYKSGAYKSYLGQFPGGGGAAAPPGMPGPPGDWKKWVGPIEHRHGPSAPHTPEILSFVGKVGRTAGEVLTPWGNESHSLTTVNGNRSAHADGRAADIPASGAELIRIGRSALVAAGMPYAEAYKQTGGLFNVGGYQVIFNTHIGGDHTNHVHVGLRG
jgi:Lysozyme like domain